MPGAVTVRYCLDAFLALLHVAILLRCYVLRRLMPLLFALVRIACSDLRAANSCSR